MNILVKIGAFIVGFSGIFWFIHMSEYYNTKILVTDPGGMLMFYSAIGTIFSIIAAFAIQNEWANWNSLVEAVKSEVDSIEEFWIWTEHLQNDFSKKIKQLIIAYLNVVIKEGWGKSERGERSEDAEKALANLRDVLFEFPKSDPQLVSLFSDLLKNRKNRLHFSDRHMPKVLRYTLIFSMSLIIFLPLLIGIKIIWLDYVFTLSISTLAYTIYVVIIDLDSPLKPGGWHLTTKDYKDLITRMSK